MPLLLKAGTSEPQPGREPKAIL